MKAKRTVIGRAKQRDERLARRWRQREEAAKGRRQAKAQPKERQ
jgi:hypothetical protein